MLNIAHRGFTKEFPDNTLEAFEAAIDLGVDAIECDVQETSDSRFVIFHEPELAGTEVSKLTEDVLCAAVIDFLRGVESKAVDVELIEPHRRVVEHKSPRPFRSLTIEVKGVSPRRLVAIGEIAV